MSNTRYAKPEAGALTRISTTVIPAGDYFAGFVVSVLGASGLAIGIPLSIAVSPFFVFMVLPTILVALMFTSYFKNTIKVATGIYDKDNYVAAAERLWADLRGQDYVEDLALPIVNKIYKHAESGGHGRWGETCTGNCNERLKVLRELVPISKRVNDLSDIDEARRFIDNLKSLNA